MAVPVERRMKRWQEQRWVLDNIIRTVGIERNEPRDRVGRRGLAYFIASTARASARRSIFERSLQNFDHNARKVHCYEEYGRERPTEAREVEKP